MRGAKILRSAAEMWAPRAESDVGDVFGVGAALEVCSPAVPSDRLRPAQAVFYIAGVAGAASRRTFHLTSSYSGLTLPDMAAALQ